MKDKTIQIRVSEEERVLIEKALKKSNLDRVSVLVLWLIKEYLRKR